MFSISQLSSDRGANGVDPARIHIQTSGAIQHIAERPDLRATWPVCKPVKPCGVELPELETTTEPLIFVTENRPNPASVLMHGLIMPGRADIAGARARLACSDGVVKSVGCLGRWCGRKPAGERFPSGGEPWQRHTASAQLV